MARDQKMKHLADLLSDKFGVNRGKSVSANLLGVADENSIELVLKAITVFSHIYFPKYDPYASEHILRMLSSPELFVRYIVFACYKVNECTKDIYERFIAVNATILCIATKFYMDDYKEFPKYTSTIMSAFFDSVVKEAFYKRGGWKRIGKYILQLEYIGYYNECVKGNKTNDEWLAKQLNFSIKLAALRKPLPYELEEFDHISIETHTPSIDLSRKILTLFQEEMPYSTLKPEKEFTLTKRKVEITNSVNRKATIYHVAMSDSTAWILRRQLNENIDASEKTVMPDQEGIVDPTVSQDQANLEYGNSSNDSRTLSTEERCLLIEGRDAIAQTLEMGLDNLKKKVESVSIVLKVLEIN